MSTTSEQKTGRDTALERDVAGPPSAPEGVGPTTAPTSGETHAYDGVAESPLAPPLPFRPSRSLKG
jgi:hypothetical protein